MEISDEETPKNPQESFPLFPAEYGPNGTAFNQELHLSKLDFFETSPYEGERTSLSPRFWTEEQVVYYARILVGKDRIFNHKILNFAKLEEMPCFHHAIEHIEHALLKGFTHFDHGWNNEVILQLYATLYISGELCRCSGYGGIQTCQPTAHHVAPSTTWYGPASTSTTQDPLEGPSLARRMTPRPPKGATSE